MDARTSTLLGGALFALVIVCVTILVALHDLDGAQVVTIATPLLPTVIGALGLHAAAHTMAAGPEPIAAAATAKELDRFVKARASRNISPPPLPLLALAALCLLATSCTTLPTPAQVATREAECVALVSIEAPAAEPLCVLGQELADAVIAYYQAHGGLAPVVATRGAVTVVPADLFALLVASPAVASRKATSSASKPCPKLPGGQVAP